LTIELPYAITFRTSLEKDITSEAFSNALNQWAMPRYDIREDVPDPTVKRNTMESLVSEDISAP
jgi:hypothetical protein